MCRVTVQFEIPAYLSYRMRQLLLAYLRGQLSAGMIQADYGLEVWRDVAALVFVCGQPEGPSEADQLAAFEAQGVQP